MTSEETDQTDTVRYGIIGIYAIRNDECSYIGSSHNIRRRWVQHRFHLRRDTHDNPHLQNAWNKYGEEAFEFVILEECPVDILHIREQHHLDRTPNHYNCGIVAESPHRGVSRSDETKAKISASLRGNKNRAGKLASPETRARISEAKKGSKGRLGVKHNDEARMKMMGNKNAAGRAVSEETRKKISAALQGVPKPSMVGNQNAAGHSPSPETRAKTSASMKAYWERKRAEEAL